MSTVRLEELVLCTDILEALASDAALLAQLSDEDRVRLFIAAGKVLHPEREQARRRRKAIRSKKKQEMGSKDRQTRAATAIRAARRDSVFVPPMRQIAEPGQNESGQNESGQTRHSAGTLQKPRDCYICKAPFSELHFFYDSMCPTCAKFNYDKRFQTVRLDGRVAIITGARMKIGYQSALMMLRAGARVVVTTRFPQDAAVRFARESDFPAWCHRLQVHGLDLRHSPSVEAFCGLMDQTLDRLDILINNAAQTVRRPPGFYAHLMEIELKPIEDLPKEARSLLENHERLKNSLVDSQNKLNATLGLTSSAALSQIPYRSDEVLGANAFPEGKLDADLQQVDQRKMNSWRMTLADVPTAEMLEVQLVNAVSPFILCGKLKPLMLRDRTDAKHIVNVSAMEGQFSRHTKTDKHPHTNMAKAALNMMTLTSARDYVKSGVFMNAVDTGWVTDEDPAEISARKQAEHDFQPPLDIVDGAARVCDPFFSGLITGKHSWGNFLKNYFPTEW